MLEEQVTARVLERGQGGAEVRVAAEVGHRGRRGQILQGLKDPCEEVGFWGFFLFVSKGTGKQAMK